MKSQFGTSWRVHRSARSGCSAWAVVLSYDLVIVVRAVVVEVIVIDAVIIVLEVIAIIVVTVGSKDGARCCVDIDLDAVVEPDIVCEHAVVAIELDLDDRRASMTLERNLLGPDQIDCRLQRRGANDAIPAASIVVVIIVIVLGKSAEWVGRGGGQGDRRGAGANELSSSRHGVLLSRPLR
jgi:hypothetical protein